MRASVRQFCANIFPPISLRYRHCTSLDLEQNLVQLSQQKNNFDFILSGTALLAHFWTAVRLKGDLLQWQKLEYEECLENAWMWWEGKPERNIRMGLKSKNSARIRVLPADLYLTHSTTSCLLIRESFSIDAVEEGPKAVPIHSPFVEVFAISSVFLKIFCLSLQWEVKKVVRNLIYISWLILFRRGLFLFNLYVVIGIEELFIYR